MLHRPIDQPLGRDRQVRLERHHAERRRSRYTRVLVAGLALVLLAGCRADVTVAVRATAEGGGVVSATVSLDEEAAAQVPDLAEQLRVSDLEAAGWRIEGPVPAAGGRTEVRAVKGFGSPAEATRVIEELSGAGGPFASLRLTRSRSFLKTRTTLAGRVDLTGGLEAFSDEALKEKLGGLPLGVDLAQLEAQLGQPLADSFGFRLTADLPGEVKANAAGATWSTRLGDVTPVKASAEQWNLSTLAFGAVSVLSGATLLGVLLRRRRSAVAASS